MFVAVGLIKELGISESRSNYPAISFGNNFFFSRIAVSNGDKMGKQGMIPFFLTLDSSGQLASRVLNGKLAMIQSALTCWHTTSNQVETERSVQFVVLHPRMVNAQSMVAAI